VSPAAVPSSTYDAPLSAAVSAAAELTQPSRSWLLILTALLGVRFADYWRTLL
jgi:hypothetical protein